MKKILFLTAHDLNAQDYGPVLRGKNIAQILSRYGEVRVILGSRHWHVLQNAMSTQGGFELAEKIQFRPNWYSFPGRIRASLKSDFLDMENYQAWPDGREKLNSLMAEHDLVWVHGLETANAFGVWKWPRSVLDVDDIPSSVYRLRLSRAKSLFKKYYSWQQMIMWRRNEKRLRRRFDAICVCSEPDKEKLGLDNVFVLPNGFDLPAIPPARHPATPSQVGFVGTFIYWANCEGVQWFIDRVWPRVLKRFPSAKLRLAGQDGEKLFKGPNVEALGWVRDMKAEMANWSLAIVPVLAGGGTRIKILEAFSRRCPVVSTSVGCYGHDVKNDRELLVADNPEQFAMRCLRILENPAEGEQLAKNAWTNFSKNSTWESQAGRIADIVANVCGTRSHQDQTDSVSTWKLIPKTIST
ncbi:MAG TPA: glycosyltransferase family 4 protein [Verrucomicrobiae bacterium]|jgi:glycosyltransferase involved in cell wall biosynthesis|nr:glycosyltransferase family 4 protein [Verrucomicrobiae bacterium]